jgi:hypothetical protein
MTTNVPAPEMSSSSGAGRPTSVVERAEAALQPRVCPDCANNCCGYEDFAMTQRAIAIVPELITEVRTLTAKLAQAEAERDTWRAKASGGGA